MNYLRCGVGDQVGRFCVYGDTPNGRTRSGMDSVLRFSFWFLCVQQSSAVGTLHVESDLVAQTIETLMWLESS